MAEEKRIYVVVAETVQPDSSMSWKRHVIQPAGRIAAQVGHVVSKMRVNMTIEQRQRQPDCIELFSPITTIVLAARNSKELLHINTILGMANRTLGHRRYEVFYDTNTDAYGWENNPDDPDADMPPCSVMTALATYPVTKDEVEGLLDHLPLWEAKNA